MQKYETAKMKKNYLKSLKDDLTRFMLVILVIVILVPLSEIVYYKLAPLSHFLRFDSYVIADACIDEELDVKLKREVNNSYSAGVVEELKLKDGDRRVTINMPDSQRTILIEDSSYEVNLKQPGINQTGSYKKIIYRNVNLPFGNSKSLTVESNEFQVTNCTN